MKEASQIVFRRLTTADFYNINKPKGSEARGGGQSYIDFPTSAVRPSDWAKFFAGLKVTNSYSGPLWKFTVNSVGIGKSQTAEIGQRRKASYNIRSQKLGTQLSNRLYAWHPQYGFPKPANPNKRTAVPNLVIYLIRTTQGEFWAGWFQAPNPQAGWSVDIRLQPMFIQEDGNIYLNPGIYFDETDGNWPFQAAAPVAAAGAAVAPAVTVPAGGPPAAARSGQPVPALGAATTKRSPGYRKKTEEEAVQQLFSDDVSSQLTFSRKQVIVQVLERNQKNVAALKALYKGNCQLTGEKYVFRKTDGEFYCEAHHLVPLGEGGADSPYNLVIVSPLIHRMLHYADVSGLDLSRIRDDKLEIEINGTPFTITWHPKHAELVSRAAKNAEAKS